MSRQTPTWFDEQKWLKILYIYMHKVMEFTILPEQQKNFYCWFLIWISHLPVKYSAQPAYCIFVLSTLNNHTPGLPILLVLEMLTISSVRESGIISKLIPSPALNPAWICNCFKKYLTVLIWFWEALEKTLIGPACLVVSDHE